MLTLDPQFVLAKEALDDVNRLIAKSATPPPAPVPAAPAAPATFAIPDRLIVLAVGLLLIIFIVWFFWLKHAIGRGTEAIIFSAAGWWRRSFSGLSLVWRRCFTSSWLNLPNLCCG